VNCDSDAVSLDSVLAVVSSLFAGVQLQQPLHLDVSAALPSVALLLVDERVEPPFLFAPKRTKMSLGRSRSMMEPVCFLLDVMSVTRRMSLIVELRALLRWKQVIHRPDGMHRKRIHFVPRRSDVFVISKGLGIL
jgi:hypothetical protein